jgi:hypothetical protein
MRARPREWQVPFGKTRESGSFYSISGSSATARIPEQNPRNHADGSGNRSGLPVSLAIALHKCGHSSLVPLIQPRAAWSICSQSCGVREARRSCGVLIRRSLVFSHCVVSDDDAARY